MSSLWDEVQNLKATMKQWEIVTLNKTSGKFVTEYIFDSKYTDWNFAILNAHVEGGNGNDYAPRITLGNNSLSCLGASNYHTSKTITFTKSGNKIVVNDSSTSGETLKVMFYK